MKRFPELKPNFWDVIVVLAVIALAAPSAMTVWRGGNATRSLTAGGAPCRQGDYALCAPATLGTAPRHYF